jgi:hypothetical protein
VLGKLAYEARSIRPGEELGEELLDLALRPMGRPPQYQLAVFRRQARGQLDDPAQVQTTVREHLQKDRVRPCGPRGVDTQVSLSFR